MSIGHTIKNYPNALSWTPATKMMTLKQKAETETALQVIYSTFSKDTDLTGKTLKCHAHDVLFQF